MKILVIDDDLFFRELLLDQLLAHQVLAVSNAIEAIERIDEFAPEVIILDLLMPAATGFSFLQEIISYDDLNKIPIVVCSSACEQVSVDYLRACGVRAVLDKTKVSPAEIEVAIKRVCS